MHIKPHIIEKYVYVEKANDWIDPDSFHSQQHLVGNVPIENILQQSHWENKLPKPLENYGIPVGLYVMHPCSRMQGGGIIPKKHDKPPLVVSDDDHEKLLKFIHIYTGKSENRVRNKTYKKRS